MIHHLIMEPAMYHTEPQKKPASDITQDCALVTHFMAYNGGMVLKYENAVEIRKIAGNILLETSNGAARAEAAQRAKVALNDMNELKPKMVHVPVSPENWTVADLKKLKNDPKSAEMFKAFVRVRDAIYDPNVQPEIRKYLAQKLLLAMPEGTEASSLRGLLDRVQTVGGGRSATDGKKTSALLDSGEDIRLNRLDDKTFDQQVALAMLDASGVKADKEHTLKAPLDTLVTDAVKGIKNTVSLAA